MEENTLLKQKVALRYQGLYALEGSAKVSMPHISLIKLADLGYRAKPELIQVLATLTPEEQANCLKPLEEALGLDKNWSPLIKSWVKHTPEQNEEGFFMTSLVNWLHLGEGEVEGERLPCGHFIPAMAFELEAYNGCPFCGTPFEFEKLTLKKQASKFKPLQLHTDETLQKLLQGLLQAEAPLEGTDFDTVKKLLTVYGLPEVNIKIKENIVLAVDALIEAKRGGEAQKLWQSSTDILRYLWFKTTGNAKIIRPKVLISREEKNLSPRRGLKPEQEVIVAKLAEKKKSIQIKLTRYGGKMVATWLNELPQPIAKICEEMHPYRGMWVRVIRAARLPMWAKKPAFVKLKNLLDAFYNERYTATAGLIEERKLGKDLEGCIQLLQKHSGLYARGLISYMLWFNDWVSVLHGFEQVMHKLPLRLPLTLAMQAPRLLDKNNRAVKISSGYTKPIPYNRRMDLKSQEELEAMREALVKIVMNYIGRCYQNAWPEGQEIYLHPLVENIKIPLGNRSDTVQDLSALSNGTSFDILGNPRFYMQWGFGLSARNYDMDLHARVLTNDNRQLSCYYGNLSVGHSLRHSGDIRSIPDKIGTAEYIEVNMQEALNEGIDKIFFYSNAYNQSEITEGLKVGWMDSANTMSISAATGVAYDPSCVQHETTISNAFMQGILFAVLDVKQQKITYLEMSFGDMDLNTVVSLYESLATKFSLGKLLRIKASANKATIVEAPTESGLNFDLTWPSMDNISKELLTITASPEELQASPTKIDWKITSKEVVSELRAESTRASSASVAQKSAFQRLVERLLGS